MLRIVYMGSPDFAVPALRALLSRPDLAQVVAVVSQPDKPTGRGQKLLPPAVKAVAIELGLQTFFQPISLRNEEAQAVLRSYQADLFVVAAYGKILPQAVLDIPRLGCVNLHASLLPKYRGAAPISAAILNGDAESGVCLMKMEAGMDTGPVYARVSTPIRDEDDTGTLTERLSVLGAELLIANLPALAAQSLVPVEQVHSEATHAGKTEKVAGLINWNQSAAHIFRHVRAYSPWPSAFTFADGKRMQIITVKAHPRTGLAPGELVAEDKRLLVGCGEGALEVLALKPEGKKVLTASEFLNGARLPITLGSNSLGTSP